MKRTVVITLALTAVIGIFGGLRVYGAYQSESDSALTRTETAEKQASILEDEGKRLERQTQCNGLWQKYETDKLEKRIAELRGQVGRTPIEPSCTGYAPRLDEATDVIFKTMEVNMATLSAREYAKYERNYAINRRLQTRYLGLRVWAFLTGTELKQKQAGMEQEQENAASLAACLARAKDANDSKIEATCREMYVKK
jgi:hypothetical protein